MTMAAGWVGVVRVTEAMIILSSSHPQDERVVCGINSVQEKTIAGQNKNCRLYSVSGDKCVRLDLLERHH